MLSALDQDLGFKPQGKRILVLGAGGACRAAIVALSRAGASWLGIANRTVERAEILVKEFRNFLPGTSFASSNLDPLNLSPAFRQIDLLVNASSVGLKGESFGDLPWEALPPSAGVYDMVYNLESTPLLNTARARGHKAADGLGMLAAQGEEAFFLWTGKKPPPGVMKAKLLMGGCPT